MQQIVWHLDVGLSFPKSVVKDPHTTIDGPKISKIFQIGSTVVGNIWTYT